MPIPRRKPILSDSLLTLRSLGVPFSTVLDVGVERETAALKLVFPDLKHHLFEPVRMYFPAIAENYAAIDHELHPVAAAEVDGETFLQSFSVYGDDSRNITHSKVSDRFIDARENPNLVECLPIRKTRLDTEMEHLKEGPYLLKVDVDGTDLQVLQGSSETLETCSAVVVEAPLDTLLERSHFLTDRGFKLFDIVDLSYYKGTLWQVDLVFVSTRILQTHPQLEAMRHATRLEIDQWFTTGYE